MPASWKQLVPHAALAIVVGVALAAAFIPTTHPAGSEPPNAATIAWMLSASGLVLLMTPGLSFFYGGLVGVRSVISTMVQSFIALGVVSIVWYTVGFSLAFGNSVAGLFGDPRTFLFFNNVGMAPHDRLGGGLPLILFATFQLKFAIITPALITGSFAERVRFGSYLLFLVFFTLFVYCPLAHATWHPDGLLASAGVLDFAGGTVVHISAGVAALAGALYLGKRTSHHRGQQHPVPNVPYVILGTGLLWFGWFGFNAGSALAPTEAAVRAFVTTNMASASAMLTWLLVDVLRGRKPSATGACIGAVVGLVAITPAAGLVSYGSSLLFGVLAAIISNTAVHLKTQTDIDDTLDVFPCHGVGGMVGMILTAVFASNLASVSLLAIHLVALVVVTVSVFALSLALYWLTDRVIKLRVAPEAEAEGLDITQHGESIIVKGSASTSKTYTSQAMASKQQVTA